MKVDISDIVRLNGASMELNFKEEPSEKELFDGCVLDGDITFSGSLTNKAGILHLDGRLLATYTSECYRCLSITSKELDLKIKEDFINSADAEQTDMYPFEGKILDIGKALEDNIVLNLPMKHLCSEQCKGLCSKCGSNFNVTQCDCGEDTMDPRMEGLNKFFEEL